MSSFIHNRDCVIMTCFFAAHIQCLLTLYPVSFRVFLGEHVLLEKYSAAEPSVNFPNPGPLPTPEVK